MTTTVTTITTNLNKVDLLVRSKGEVSGKLVISGSKSQTNRLLLLQAQYPQLVLENVSDSDDSAVMAAALQSKDGTIDIHHAGTAMRFLTAYYAIQEGKTVILTGSARLKERPIAILVDALRQLGAAISYEGNEGFPPLRITGKKLSQNKAALNANVSSQYISALLLIAPKLENGLQLTLKGEITSRPYIEMTLGLLSQVGVRSTFEGNTITVDPATGSRQPTTITIESDWSSASYYYSIVALSAIGTQITLSIFNKDSFQGDSVLAEIYKDFGVQTVFNGGTVILEKTRNPEKYKRSLDLNPTPDLAQTIAVTCLGLGLACSLTGLHTLKIKETDRLQALKNELSKFGADIAITENSLSLRPLSDIRENVRVKTYNDHRMAMAFAPLAAIVPVVIEDARVVSKSYRDFWEHLKQIGFQITRAGN